MSLGHVAQAQAEMPSGHWGRGVSVGGAPVSSAPRAATAAPPPAPSKSPSCNASASPCQGMYNHPPNSAKKSQQFGRTIRRAYFWRNASQSPGLWPWPPKHTVPLVAVLSETCGNPCKLKFFLHCAGSIRRKMTPAERKGVVDWLQHSFLRHRESGHLGSNPGEGIFVHLTPLQKWKTRQPRIPQTQLQNPLQAPVARNPLIGGLLMSCPKNGG